jgi:hypothetical protein
MMFGHLNLIALDKKTDWEYPTAGNILTGEKGQAVCIICDYCLEHKMPIKFALKLVGDDYIYVPVDSLGKFVTGVSKNADDNSVPPADETFTGDEKGLRPSVVDQEGVF